MRAFGRFSCGLKITNHLQSTNVIAMATRFNVCYLFLFRFTQIISKNARLWHILTGLCESQLRFESVQIVWNHFESNGICFGCQINGIRCDHDIWHKAMHKAHRRLRQSLQAFNGHHYRHFRDFIGNVLHIFSDIYRFSFACCQDL